MQISAILKSRKKGRLYMAVTIKEVAALAGVSPSTVSRTCNNSPLISKKTQERVRKAMEELGYEPVGGENPAESGKSLGAIGIVLPSYQQENFENPFYLDVIRGISKTCNHLQYATCVLSGKNESELLESIDLLRKSSSKITFILLYSQENDPIAEYLYDEGLRYVMIGAPLQHDTETISVDNDNFSAAYDACKYLIEHGHKQIGYIGLDSSLAFSARRKQGYQMALLEHDLALTAGHCMEFDPTDEQKVQALQDMLTQKNRLTALLVVDDLLALAINQLCRQFGLHVPEDISIVSFNNSVFAKLSIPSLTSVDIHARQLGIEAALQAINHLETPDLTPSKVIVPYSLVERDSVKTL